MSPALRSSPAPEGRCCPKHTSNVECVGGGQWAKQRVPYGQLPRFQLVPTGGKPCGWMGKRQSHIGRNAPALDPAIAKPCPRCGGRVKLIQPQPTNEGRP